MTDATQPQVLERACGGWLARAPRESRVHIAVTADDEATARQALAVALAEWDRLLGQAAAEKSDA
jgi:hypothetical protein